MFLRKPELGDDETLMQFVELVENGSGTSHYGAMDFLI